MNKRTIREITITALLVALSVTIPLTFPAAPLPDPFSATLASHVPALIAMFISPWSVIATVVGSALAFFMRRGLIVALRALSHLVFGLSGYYMLSRRMNIFFVGAVTMLLHALCEMIIVIAFGGTAFKDAAYGVGLVAIVHHIIDFSITIVVIKALTPANIFTYVPSLFTTRKQIKPKE